MSARLRTFAALALTLLAAAPARAGGDPSSAQSTVQALEGLALWCQEHRLYGKRNRACEAMLRVDPEHARARQWLRHARAADGRWKPPPKAAAARDFDAAALVEFAARLEPLLDELRSRAAASACASERRGALELVLVLDPDDAQAHQALGEIRWEAPTGERLWVSSEAEQARRRRAAIEGHASALLASPEREACSSRGTSAVLGPTAKVSASAAAQDEVDQAMRLLAASEMLVREAAPGATGLPPGTVVHLLSGPTERDRFLERCARLGQGERERLRRFDSFWLPESWELVVACAGPRERLEQVVLQSVSVQLTHAFGVNERWGWLFEGFALYASDVLLGDARPYAVAGPGETGWRLHAIELPAGEDLRNEALARLRAGGGPRLREMLPRAAAAMDRDDLLLSYLLVAFLTETTPDAIAALSWGWSVGQAPEAFFAEELGWSLEELADTVLRTNQDLERMRECCQARGAARAAR